MSELYKEYFSIPQGIAFAWLGARKLRKTVMEIIATITGDTGRDVKIWRDENLKQSTKKIG